MPALEPEPLWSALEHVGSLGNRFAGTPGEERAREWLLGEFERFGLPGVHADEFRFLAYEPEGSSCTAPGHDWESACAGLQFSADGVAEGEAVYLGSCRPEDVAALEAQGVELRGKVAVAHSYHTWLVAPQLAAKGVAALVNVGDSPDGLVGHFPASFYPQGLAPPWEG